MDELRGTNSPSCGFNRTTPCKSLNEGLKKAHKFGTVYVIGQHSLQHTIMLIKSVIIKSDFLQTGIITSNAHIIFAFIVGCEAKRLELEGLHFENIETVYLHKRCDLHIIMRGITVNNTSGTKMKSIQLNAKNVPNSNSLRIYNSRFVNTSGISISYFNFVHLENCIFSGSTNADISNGLIHASKVQKLRISNCHFSAVVGSFLIVDQSSAIIMKTTFYGSTSFLGCAVFDRVKMFIIKETKFENCR